MTRKKILVVDDNPVILKAIAFKLDAAGFDTVVAQDGAEAVQAVHHEPPDLIIVDVVFPADVSYGGGVPWDGFLIMDWLRRFGDATTIPFIVITSGDPVEYQVRALDAGAVGFFAKPLDYADLIGLIGRTLDSKAATVPRILIVDDDPVVHMLYKRHLEREGFELLMARDGVEALRVAARAKPDLIVMDIMMPGEDGLATLRKLRADETMRDVPVLVITANVSQYEAIGKEARFGGAAGLLTKPLSPSKLVSEVRRVRESRE